MDQDTVRNNILTQLITLTRSKLVIKKDIDINENTSFQDDLNADSIDLTDLVMEIETTFKIKISDRDMEKIKTVRDAVDLICAKKSQ